MAKPKDMVYSPAHYAENDIECIDAMISAFGIEAVEVYCRLASFKYQWRAGKKFDADEDLKNLSGTPALQWVTIPATTKSFLL